jgi:hypothetical protein
LSLASPTSGKHCGIEVAVHISTFYNRILCEKVIILVLHSTLRCHVSLPGVLLTLPDVLFFCNGIL